MFRIPSEEVKHISAERRADLAEEYSDAERETRIEGTPQLGAGPVFPLELIPACVKPFNPDAIHPYAKWIVGIDFGFDHPFAAVLMAWVPDLQLVYVVDSFTMTRSSALYHVQRIHAMCRGLKVPVAYPHDGSVHDKGSGLPLAQQYKNFGANMLSKWATNHSTGNYEVRPGIEEIRELMFAGKLSIAGHNHELLEELRAYHFDENFKIVKIRDDLISAFRYAWMSRRFGKPLSECEGIGYVGGSGRMPFAYQQPGRPSRPRIADGIDFDPFTGR